MKTEGRRMRILIVAHDLFLTRTSRNQKNVSRGDAENAEKVKNKRLMV